MMRFGEIVRRSWRSLPDDIRTAANPNNYGELTPRIWKFLLSPLVHDHSNFRIGRWPGLAVCDDPSGLRAVLDSLVPQLAAVAVVLRRLVPASDHVGCAVAHRMEKLLPIARLNTAADGRITIDLTGDVINRLVAAAFPVAHDDPDQSPPTLNAFNRLLADDERVVLLDAELDQLWDDRSHPAEARSPETAEAQQALLSASANDWRAEYEIYRALEPWRVLASSPGAALLTDQSVATRPALRDGYVPPDKVNEDSVRPLDRSVENRIRKRFDRRNGKTSYSFVTNKRYANVSTSEIVAMAMEHACAPLGLPDEDCRTMVAVAVLLDAYQGVEGNPGSLLAYYQAILDSHEHVAAAHREPDQRLSELWVARLWITLYGQALFLDNGVETTLKTLRDRLYSAGNDLWSGWAETSSKGTVPSSLPDPELLGPHLRVVRSTVTDAGAPVDVRAFLTQVRTPAAPTAERRRAERWKEIVGWQKCLHPDVPGGDYPSYSQLCTFIRQQWATSGEENDHGK